ncbi:MAG: 6-phosphogluconolactonase [Pseudomonadota bacterium]
MSTGRARVSWSAFADRSQAAAHAAAVIAARLAEDLSSQDRVSIVVSGGSSPVECLGLLAREPIDWARVDVILSDEREVREDHELSNARMVREAFFNQGAEAAVLHSLTEPSLVALPQPFSAVLLGMGTDGHFASVFPDMNDLDAALALDEPRDLMSVVTAASPVARVTQTLSRLLRTQQILLLVFGEEKRAVLDAPAGKPIAALLEQTQTSVALIWAP